MSSAPLREVGERAGELFGSGFNCAEAVLQANMEHLGVRGEWFPRVATGFGSGVSQAGQLCGVVSGAVMAGGWLLGRDEPTDSRDELYDVIADFMRDFKAGQGSVVCRELIGLDLSDPAERDRARRQGLFATRCRPLVVFGAASIAGLLSARH
jgi:C_GCAxxG_C_C family probable redox protein